jgi:hypothetical protein
MRKIAIVQPRYNHTQNKLEVREQKKSHVISQMRAEDEGKRNERRDHSVQDERDMMVTAFACTL